MEEGRVPRIPWQSRMRTTWAPFELGTLVDMFLSMLSMAVSQETPQSQRFLPCEYQQVYHLAVLARTGVPTRGCSGCARVPPVDPG